MTLKKYKEYIIFIASVGLFLLILGYEAVVYFNYNKPVTENAITVEVNLPVIDWQKYQNLSKHYQ